MRSRNVSIPEKEDFRTDINALRAIAVTLVLLFHFQVSPFFAGGFIGVDVFFVISGFLMTRIIMNDLERNKFGILKFYLNRIARIAPALLILTIVCLLIGYLILLPSAFVQLAKEASYAQTFLINIFYATNTNYFAPAAERSWFLHCWSLAVEFQFYILFPVLIILAFKLGGRKSVFITLVSLIIVSAAICWIWTKTDPSHAFYLLPSRSWEFAAGGLVVFLPRLRSYQNVFFAFGIFAIFVAASMFDSAMGFPGLWPLIPVFGSILVIGAAPKNIVTDNPVVQFLGNTSYSIYLWHWPYLAIARYLFSELDSKIIAGLVAITIISATLSFYFIERPFRNVVRSAQWQPRVTLGLLAAFSALFCGSILFSGGMTYRIPVDVLEKTERAQYHGEYREGICFLTPTQTASDFSPLCFEPPSGTGKPQLVVWGDSTAAHLYPGIVEQNWARKYSIIQVTASSCPAFASQQSTRCVGIQRDIEARILSLSPDKVILGAGWSVSDNPNVALAYEREVESKIRTLKAGRVKQVVIAGPALEWDIFLPDNYYRSLFWPRNARDASYRRPVKFEQLRLLDKKLKRATEAAGGTYVSYVDEFCDEKNCTALIDDTVGTSFLQFDTLHLTTAGSRRMAAHAIGPAIGELVPSRAVVARDAMLNFHMDGNGIRYMASGWMPAEQWGSWTASSDRPGVLVLPLDKEGIPEAFKISFWGQLGPLMTSENFKVKIGASYPIDLRVSSDAPHREALFFLGPTEKDDASRSGYLRIEFSSPEGKSGRQLGVNDDNRVLGFGLKAIKLLPRPAPVSIGQTLSFSETGNGSQYLSKGWMPQEGWGVWNADRSEPGVVLLPVEDGRLPKTITVGFWGQLGPNMGFEKFSFRISGDPPVKLTVSHSDNHKESVVSIGAGALQNAAVQGFLKIDVWAPEGKNGRQLGLGNDDRVLGFGLKTLKLNE